MDMLSAKKVHEHGIKDKRWGLKEKMSQYREMVKLYKREMVMLHNDIATKTKQNREEVKRLVKMLINVKEELDNNICGGRRMVENVLISNKDLRLKCRNLRPDQILEKLKQDIYAKRKQMDLFFYNRKKKERTLVDLKLCYGEIEDRLTYEHLNILPTDEPCKRLTGQIQNRLLLVEAAICTKNTYLSIIRQLRDGSWYYDALIQTLHRDIMDQDKCIIQLIVLGQVATEYLDDRKLEFKKLKHYIKEANKVIEHDIKKARDILETMPNRLRELMKQEENNEVDPFVVKEASMVIDVSKSLAAVCDSIEMLKNAVRTTRVEDIFPLLQNEMELDEKLCNLTEKQSKNIKTLKQTLERRKFELQTELHTNHQEIVNYCEKKNCIKDEIRNIRNKIGLTNRKKEYLCDKISNISSNLKSIHYFCCEVTKIDVADECTTNEAIKNLTSVVQIISSKLAMDVSAVTIGPAELAAFNEIWEYPVKVAVSDIAEDTEELEIISKDVPTRFDVKENSRKIVEYFKSLDL